MNRRLEINHSSKGEYYEMYIDGKFQGNYDSVKEAADEYEHICEEEDARGEQSA